MDLGFSNKILDYSRVGGVLTTHSGILGVCMGNATASRIVSRTYFLVLFMFLGVV